MIKNERTEITSAIVFGTFDLFHVGHYFLIKKILEKNDDVLYIAIASDNWLKIRKKNPIQNELTRKKSILQYFPKVHVLIEDSSKPFEYFDQFCLNYNISHVYGGHDQKGLKSLILKFNKKYNKNLNFEYFDRTANISTTLMKETISRMVNVDNLKISNDFKDLDNFIKTQNLIKNKKNVYEWKGYIIKSYQSSEDPCLKHNYYSLNFQNVETFFSDKYLFYKKINGNTFNNIEIRDSHLELIKNKINLFKNFNIPESQIKDIDIYLKQYKTIIDHYSLKINFWEDIVNSLKNVDKTNKIVYTHGDLNSKNIILDFDERISFIDCDWTSYTYELFDPAAFICHNNLSIKQRWKFMKNFISDENVIIDAVIWFLFHDYLYNYRNGMINSDNEIVNYSNKQYKKLLSVLDKKDLIW